jgi:predicted aconitase with swiveling domain
MELIHGRRISNGVAEGQALISHEPISFFGGVNPDTGVVVEKGHELEGKSVKDRVLIFPRGKGSTVGSYTLYRMKKNGVAPKAIVNLEAEPIVAVGAIIAEIPAVDKLERDPFSVMRSGMRVRVDADASLIEILE